MRILKFLSDYWPIIGAAGTAMIAWGTLTEQVAKAQADIVAISHRVEEPHPVTSQQIQRLIEIAQKQDASMDEMRMTMQKMLINQGIMCQQLTLTDSCSF